MCVCVCKLKRCADLKLGGIITEGTAARALEHRLDTPRCLFGICNKEAVRSLYHLTYRSMRKRQEEACVRGRKKPTPLDAELSLDTAHEMREALARIQRVC